jgi:colanic acid biosynthesis glycosyl transferase WcaI
MTDTRRILIVGINYAPEHTGIAPYTTGMAEHLAEDGNEVLVLTGLPHYPQWEVPEAFRCFRRTTEQHDNVAVRRLRHYVPRTQSAAKRAAYEASFGAHVLSQRLPWTPDVVIAVIPSLFGAAAAAKLAKRRGAPLAVVVQDLMGKAALQSGIAGGGRVAKATAALEGRVLRSAESVAVISDAFRDAVREYGVPDERITHMPNWSHVKAPRDNRAEVRRRMGWRDDDVIALHAGNMGLKQDLGNVVEAARLAEAKAPHVRFVLMGDGSQRDTLAAQAEDVRNCQILAPAHSDDFMDILAGADVLLVNERRGIREMSLPSKLTTYLAAGRPVIAATEESGATAREVNRSQCGVVVSPGEPAALLDGVLALAIDPNLSGELGWRGRAHAAEHLSPMAARQRARGLVMDLGVRASLALPHHQARTE